VFLGRRTQGMVDLIAEPESPRYGAELVLVHGLWSGPWLWSAAAPGFAHRGWRCLMFDGRPRRARGDAGRDDLAAWLDDLLAAIQRLEAPPVLLGHDVGGLLALALAGGDAVRAAIAVAPLLEGIGSLVKPLPRVLGRLVGREIPPPDPAHPVFAAEGEATPADLREQMASEPAARVLAVAKRLLAPAAPRVPTLLVAQASDAAVSPVAVEIAARGIEADFQRHPGGHWPMLGDGADAWVGRIHRWVIQRCGASLLLLRGDEDLRDE
jgi:pimeloyl-ACP methyl ester carboxylesterase